MEDITKAVNNIVDTTNNSIKRALSEEELDELRQSLKNAKTNHPTSKERLTSQERKSRIDQPRSSGLNQGSRSRSRSKHKHSNHETSRSPSQSREKSDQKSIKSKNSPPKKIPL